jgi:hypothetical protein
VCGRQLVVFFIKPKSFQPLLIILIKKELNVKIIFNIVMQIGFIRITLRHRLRTSFSDNPLFLYRIKMRLTLMLNFSILLHWFEFAIAVLYAI